MTADSLVTSVLGTLSVSELGRVDAHEHLFLRSPVLPGEELEDPDHIRTEINDVHASGIDTIIDLTTIGLGRSPSRLAQLSKETGVHVILATGVHRSAHYRPGHWMHTIGEDELYDLLLTDLTHDIDDGDWQGPRPRTSGVRAGIIKLGASYHRVSAAERRWFAAGARAALEANVAVAVHLEIGTAAHEVLDLLDTLGVSATRVMLAHLDRNMDPALHAEIASRGAYLGYDGIGRTKYHTDSAEMDLIGAIVDQGYGDRILLGTDTARRSSLRAYGGGPGMDYLSRVFLRRLRERYGTDLIDALLINNPRTFLSTSVRPEP